MDQDPSATNRDPNAMDRRRFLKTGAQALAGASALGAALAGSAGDGGKVISLAGGIPTRKFGKTGHDLPVLGHGGSAMTRTFIRAYGVELPSEDDRMAMVRHGYEMGIRYFDTARVYGESERLMGAALKDVRKDVYLCSKVAAADPAKVRQSVEASLTDLQTDYVDCMQIHSPVMEKVGYDGGMRVFDELQKMREEGMIRFIGLTTHVVFKTVHQMIDTGKFDQVLLAYGYFRRGMTSILSTPNTEWREACLARAHALDMGIVAMKVLGADVFSHNSVNLLPDYAVDRRALLPAAAIRWTLSDPRVCVLNIGMSLKSDIDADVAIVKGPPELTGDDRAALAEYASLAYETEAMTKLPIT